MKELNEKGRVSRGREQQILKPVYSTLRAPWLAPVIHYLSLFLRLRKLK